MFNKELSTKEFNEWIKRNGYSKQIPLDDQITGKESNEICRDIYQFSAKVYQKPNNCTDIVTSVFYARVELNDETWPLFQHFMRLLTDPFIYIRTLELFPQMEVLHLLNKAMNPDSGRLQCNRLKIDLNGYAQGFNRSMKDHVRCSKFEIDVDNGLNFDEELLDIILTGEHCTPMIYIYYYDLSNVIVDLVQKFTSLKNRDEYQIVETVCGDIKDQGVVEVLKRKCAEFIAEVDQIEEDGATCQIIGFINADIEMKMTLSAKHSLFGFPSGVSIQICNVYHSLCL